MRSYSSSSLSSALTSTRSPAITLNLGVGAATPSPQEHAQYMHTRSREMRNHCKNGVSPKAENVVFGHATRAEMRAKMHGPQKGQLHAITNALGLGLRRLTLNTCQEGVDRLFKLGASAGVSSDPFLGFWNG